MLHIQASSQTEQTVGVNTEELVKLLNVAFSSEWIAFYQYTVAAAIVRGKMRPDIEKHLTDHAWEEFGHSRQLMARIIDLGGTPITNINEMANNKFAPFLEPTNVSVEAIVDQTIESEQGAIKLYNEIANFVMGKDHATYSLISRILADEQRHERDFLNFKEDFAV